MIDLGGTKRTSKDKVSWIHSPYLRLKVAVTNTVP